MFSKSNPNQFYEVCLNHLPPGDRDSRMGSFVADVGRYRVRMVRDYRFMPANGPRSTSIVSLRDHDDRLFAMVIDEDGKLRWKSYFRDDGSNMTAFLSIA